MKKAVALSLVGVFLGASLFVSPASALPPFKKAFEDKYVTNSSSEGFKDAFKAASCNTCHVKGKDKKSRNAYGAALAKITGGHAKKDLDDAKASGGDDAQKAKMAEILKKLDDAFAKVEGQKSPSGDTYGDLIKAGKLPAGT
ncbi:MAG TPA: hypothetical protein VGY55_21850 [Pirellulales bacterium]|jgi:hypothetical protein|nr:hypothetical protein [Pirellulales bacterium]